MLKNRHFTFLEKESFVSNKQQILFIKVYLIKYNLINALKSN